MFSVYCATVNGAHSGHLFRLYVTVRSVTVRLKEVTWNSCENTLNQTTI